MNVFLAVASLKPTYGGPAFSVSQLASALSGAGARVGLWAPDGSAPGCGADAERLAGPAEAAMAAFGSADLIHDNGIWLGHNHRLAVLARRAGLPRVVSPRGMLEPWARAHKRLKKDLAWAFYQRADLATVAALHATAETEGANLARFGFAAPVRVIPNGLVLPPEPVAAPGPGARTALFLGRIYPVKGLPMLVEAWRRARPPGWRLVIAGPDEAGHRGEVERAVRKAGLEEAVTFTGPVDEAAKAGLLAQADLFVLPSHSESFGMAVGEALAHGAPVLTTTAVPWPALEEHGCGWRATPEPAALADALAKATALERTALRAMGARGRELVARSYGWSAVAQAFLALYEEVAAGRRG